MLQGRRIARAALAVCAVGVASQAGGAPIGLTQAFPDVTATGVNVTYTYNSGSGVGTLNVTGTPTGFELTGVAPVDYSITGNGSRSFTIQMQTNAAGDVLPGSSFSVIGRINAFGMATVGTLLQGSIVDFGFPETVNGMNLEFQANVTGGRLFDLGYFGGGSAGIILNFGQNGYPGSLTQSFSTTSGNGTADIFAPTPAAAGAGAVLLAATSLVRRRRLDA